MTEINLNFMHPKYGTVFNADIDGAFTVGEMIENLLDSGFLPPNAAGYQLALGKDALDNEIIFEEIETLYEGDILRVIALEGDTADEQVSDQVLIHLKHPTRGIVFDMQAHPEMTSQSIVERLLDKGFIQGLPDQYALMHKGQQELKGDQTIGSAAISAHDFIQVVQLGTTAMPAITPMFHAVNKRLETLEQGISQELKQIKENLPKPSVIPLDQERAINPTSNAYESIDTIVNRLRQDSKLAPLKPIRSIQFMPYLLALAAFLLLLAGFFFVKALSLF